MPLHPSLRYFRFTLALLPMRDRVTLVVFLHSGGRSHGMKRTVLILTVFVAVLAGTRPALPWGSAVHAYIGAHLGDRGIDRKDMIYGGVAPDTFNFLFDDPAAMEYLYAV